MKVVLFVVFSPCVTDNSTYIGSAMFGVGDESLTVNTWEFYVSYPGLLVKMAVTRDHCIPVAETIKGTIDGGQCVLLIGKGLQSDQILM